MDPFVSLQTRLGHVFANPALLREALTHPSYFYEHPTEGPHNQRLEFLGDAVLQLVLSEALFTRFPHDREGALSKRRSALSNGKFLSDLARQISLDACLLLGNSEEQSGGRHRDAALEDALEAVIGAIHIDSDIATTRRIVLALIGSLDERLAAVEPAGNPKGRLQEIIQSQPNHPVLRYVVTHVAGEDHARLYEATTYLDDQPLGTGRGTSKKSAEEAAALAALATLQATKS